MIKLPDAYKDKQEWTILGPMGPQIPPHLSSYPILAIDGGGHYSDRIDVWVGDSDSLKKEISPVASFKFPPEKESSDLALGLELFKQSGPMKLHLWGFRGGRIDHELFNLGECMRFLSTHPESQILMYGEDGKVYFHLVGEGHWNFEYEGIFSIGTVKKTIVRLKGACDYPLLKETIILPLSSLGLSNVAHGKVQLETQGAVFIAFPEGK